jgi:hypothetical protein
MITENDAPIWTSVLDKLSIEKLQRYLETSNPNHTSRPALDLSMFLKNGSALTDDERAILHDLPAFMLIHLLHQRSLELAEEFRRSTEHACV